MKPNVYFPCLFGLMVLAGPGQTNNIVMETTAKPLSCKLTTPELQKRKATVIAELKALILTKAELANGCAYTFEGTDDTLDKLTTFIKTERLCCDFFTFQLTVDQNKALLQITGPEGAKKFLAEEVGL